MALKHLIRQLLSAHGIAVTAFFLAAQAGGHHAHAAGLNDQRMSSAHDAQVLRAYDWVLLNGYDPDGREVSNLQAAGSGRPQLSFLKEGVLVVGHSCVSVSGQYQIAENNALSSSGYSIAGSFCAQGMSWGMNILTTALSQLRGFQVLPNQNKFKVRLLLHFADGSHWALAPTNKLLIID